MAVSNSRICLQNDEGAIVTIPSSEWARILRHMLELFPEWVTAKQLAIDLGTIEIHPRLSQLRNRFGVEIDTVAGPRRQKLYRLSPSVQVVEVEAANDS